MLAKVCGEQNKPNGQFYLPSRRDAVLDFIRDLSVRKIGGIGKVTQQMLDSIGVKTCSDLFRHRAVLSQTFSPKSFGFFLRVSLGIQQPPSSQTQRERKSISTERTFRELSRPVDLIQKLKDICTQRLYIIITRV